MFFTTIQNRLRRLNSGAYNELATTLGYRSNKAKIAFDKLVNAKDLASFLRVGHYDLLYNSTKLLIGLARAFKLDENALKIEINKAQKHNDEIEKFQKCYIFIDTHFVRKNEPIFALAMCECERRIWLGKYANKLVYKSNDEILAFIKKLINHHYFINKGTSKFCGKIYAYQVNLPTFSCALTPNGESLKTPISESFAYLRI
ncbi:MAG: hypothetical protein K5978_05655 [Campylobacter sp.]|nr:hypothetical protein [Campylobacter sp.]